MTATPIKKLSSRGGHFVSLLLAEHCKGDGRCAVYAEGWSDLAIANEAARRSGETVTAKNVAYVRLAVCGQLRRSEPEGTDARLDALTKRLDTFEGRVDIFEDRFNDLVRTVTKRLDAIESALTDPAHGDLFGGSHVNGGKH